MFDNGLLKYYKYKSYRDGFLDTHEARVKENAGARVFDNTVKCTSPLGSFYKKFKHFFSKETADAEILLSQIYYGAGLNSTIYTPASDGNDYFLLCNDISQQNTIKAQDFNQLISLETGCSEAEIKSIMANPNPSGSEIVKYFSQRALAQKVKTRVLDAATLNPDRQESNYFYVIDSSGKAIDVATLDYERSGIEATNRIAFGRHTTLNSGYQNDFGLTQASPATVIDAIKRSEFVSSVVELPTIAEEVGNINVNDVALDIARTTGYVVEPKYVDVLSRSLDQTAEMLIK